MSTSSKRSFRFRSALSAGVGLLLTGIATVPAHADTAWARQWHLKAMHAEEMWKTSTGRGITVAVIDSGVDDSGPDLRGQVLDGKDYSKLAGDEHKDHGDHGTGMAGLIAATGAQGKADGVFGLAPEAKILPIRMVSSNEGYGKVNVRARFFEYIAKSIRFAADSDAQIINISLGQFNSPGKENTSPPQLNAAVKYANGKGKLIFAAVGNNGNTSNFLGFPGATPGVVGVSGVDQKAKPVENSQWGPQVDLAAPAKDIASACAGSSRLCSGTGTSNASALASASAALLWSKHPDWTNNQVLRVLMTTASGNDKGLKRDDVVGYGVIRPRIALKNPGNPGPADEYPIPDLAAAAPKSPSPDASKSTGDSGKPKKDNKSAAATTASPEDDNTTLWVTLGLGAAALIGTAIAFGVIRTRRRSSATGGPFG
ncbi:type VII secretion-associated serine protease mycosin [Streptomyces sp. 21So2-11]|uniref:type VII secretion-associated serine protease mycosin n=1 Tax=Streptomyces sp. 21So2-11 TaxID=3144408 RepID=UPI0032195378